MSGWAVALVVVVYAGGFLVSGRKYASHARKTGRAGDIELETLLAGLLWPVLLAYLGWRVVIEVLVIILGARK